MDEREPFRQSGLAMIARTIERIRMMTEPEVLNSLHALKASRDSYGETLTFLNSVAFVPSEDSERELSDPRSQLSSVTHPAVNPLQLWDYIEDELKKRLETLKKKDK